MKISKFILQSIRFIHSLSRNCKLAVGNFTEEQAERVELNPIISAACYHIIELHCEVQYNFFKNLS